VNFYFIAMLCAFVWLSASALLAKLKRWRTWWAMMAISAAAPVAFLASLEPDLSGPAMIGVGMILLIGWGTVFVGLVLGGIVVLDANRAKSTETKKGH
jgi:hypothetical protein